jgi:cell division protein FtsN
MARDYAKRPKKRKKAKKPISGWAWLVTGLLIGLVLAAVAYLKLIVSSDEGERGPSIFVSSKEEKKPSKPKFDFYTLLPEMEVEVPESRSSSSSSTPPPAAKPTPKTTTAKTTTPEASKTIEQAKYRLQLASFKQFDEADSMKARLALEGIFVEIQTVTLDSGQTWYRVRTTQFEDRNEALTLQKNLQKQAINSMLLSERER